MKDGDRVSDADFHAATALALGQVLGEIATLVGLNPDDGELYPIIDRVRRLGAERQQWTREEFRLAERDGWSAFGSHADDGGAELEFDGKDTAGMPLWERPKSRRGDSPESARYAVVLPEHAYGHIASALADSPHLSEVEVLAALGVITKLLDSWCPVEVAAAPDDDASLCEKCRYRDVHDPDRPRSIFGHFCLDCVEKCHDMSDESGDHMCVIDRWHPCATGVTETGRTDVVGE